jgi:MFS family permease
MLVAIRREYASLPHAFWVLLGGSLISRLGAFVIPFLAIYVGRVRGHGEVAAGLVMASWGVGGALAGVLGGVLSDRVGRRATLIASLFGGAAAMLLLGLVESLWLLCAAAFLVGLVGLMVRPASFAAVADLVPAGDRNRAFTYLYWTANIGFALSMPLGGLALGTGQLTIFIADAATTALYGLVVWARVPETRPSGAAHVIADGDWRSVLSDRVLLGVTALTFGLEFVMTQNASALPLDMLAHGVSAQTYGWLFAINGGLIVALQPAITRWLEPRSRTAALVVSSLLVAVGMGLYAVVTAPPGYALAIAIWTFGEIVIGPLTSTVVADIAPLELRGRYQGVSAMAWSVASSLAPLVGGAVLAGFGGRVLWSACLVLMLAVAAGHAALSRARVARELQMRTAQHPDRDLEQVA